jgi:serine protease DegS
VIISVNDKPAVSALETMDQVAEIRPLGNSGGDYAR